VPPEFLQLTDVAVDVAPRRQQTGQDVTSCWWPALTQASNQSRVNTIAAANDHYAPLNNKAVQERAAAYVRGTDGGYGGSFPSCRFGC
jgi:hypothetical protein